MRIEMRQVGVRDEAKMIGGLGVCGRCLCCSSFMTAFEPVTIQKARKQQIVINPTKISGLCGRLMCCLGFEEATRGRMFSQSDDRLIED
jgi:cell fate regulator YaaT (PSP1 superfamily)